jgi:hypothetical protein
LFENCSSASTSLPNSSLLATNKWSLLPKSCEIMWKCMEGTLECFDTKDKDHRTRWGHVVSCVYVHCLPYKLAIRVSYIILSLLVNHHISAGAIAVYIIISICFIKFLVLHFHFMCFFGAFWSSICRKWLSFQNNIVSVY